MDMALKLSTLNVITMKTDVVVRGWTLSVALFLTLSVSCLWHCQ